MDTKFLLKVTLVTLLSLYVVLVQLDNNGSNQKNIDPEKKILDSVNNNLKSVYKVNEIERKKNEQLLEDRLNIENESAAQLKDEDELRKYGLDSRSSKDFDELYKDFGENEGRKKMDLDYFISKRINDRKWIED